MSKIKVQGNALGAGTSTLQSANSSSSVTFTLPDAATNVTLGYLNVPSAGTKTTSYTLAPTDVGEYVQIGSGGSITIPDETFVEGDIISLFNNTTGDITITCSITTAYIAGTDTDTDTLTLAARGVATVLFISDTVCVVIGNVTAPPPVEPLPAIGSAYAGGFYAGQISTAANGVATHNLVVGPRSTAQSGFIAWSATAGATPGTDSLIDGPTNTNNMDNSNHPAAQFCTGLTVGGYSDWYMPALNELEICYYNLKPTTDSNDTAMSVPNLNAVPQRSDKYSPETPAQTSATQFQSGNSESFDPVVYGYWTSTEFSNMPNTASMLKFSSGVATIAYKQFSYYGLVRAVRRVPV